MAAEENGGGTRPYTVLEERTLADLVVEVTGPNLAPGIVSSVVKAIEEAGAAAGGAITVLRSLGSYDAAQARHAIRSAAKDSYPEGCDTRMAAPVTKALVMLPVKVKARAEVSIG